ncbi:MAG: glycogen-binding domain-containing protein [Planctomycetota bacterium]
MISLESGGQVCFTIDLPDAEDVVLVGRFAGYHDQHLPMQRISACRWTIRVQLDGGEYVFGYLVNGDQWLLDSDAHGTVKTAEGRMMSRLWCPPPSIEPDTIAA